VLAAGKVRCSPSSPCSRRSGHCAWLRAAPLLPSPPLRATALLLPGRDGKAGASTELESCPSTGQGVISTSRSDISNGEKKRLFNRGATLLLLGQVKHLPGDMIRRHRHAQMAPHTQRKSLDNDR
jgi:hypothetical protein